MDSWHHACVRGLLLMAALAGVAAASAQARATPALRLVARTPLTVAGAHFAPRAAVAVSVESVRVTTRADAAGRFRLVVRGVPLGGCSSPRVLAVDSRGSRASLRVPPLACMTARG